MQRQIFVHIFSLVVLVFLSGNSKAETVTINWSGTISIGQDISSWENHPQSLANLGIVAGAPYSASLTYDSTTLPIYADTGARYAFFQGTSLTFSVDGKLGLQISQPKIQMYENSNSWNLNPFVKLNSSYNEMLDQTFYSWERLAFNDSLSNETVWKPLAILSVQNNGVNLSAYNPIGLSYDQLPSVAQFQQIANAWVDSYFGTGPGTPPPVQEVSGGFTASASVGGYAWYGFGNSNSDEPNLAVAPEPSAVSLLAIGLGGVIALRRCRRSAD